jgi:carboxypeptidase Taq
MLDPNLLERFRASLRRIAHFQKVNSLLFWDSMQKVPPKGAKGRAATQGAMAEETRRLKTSTEMKEFLDALRPFRAELNMTDRALLRVAEREYAFFQRLPGALFQELEATKGESVAVWERVMRKGEYAPMIPYLDRLMELNKQMADAFGHQICRYDALIDFYEEGMTCRRLDDLFGELKEALIPLITKIVAKKVPRPAFLSARVPVSVQDGFNRRLARIIGVDPEAAVLGEMTHPFCFNINIGDIRYSTRYSEDDFSSSLFSVLHEGGHAINGLNIPEELESTILGGGTSAAFQESQSRFYENIIGRSLPFWEAIYDDFMADYQPYLPNVTPEDLFRGFNHVEPGFIRTSADEVTYNLHILLRYEMERDFINGKVAAADLPAIWNAKVRKYLGLEVPNDRLGILQDIQWPYGRFGAFVSYTVGNVYGAQILDAMKRDFDVDARVRAGDFDAVKAWLGENVHRFSQLLTPDELIRRVTGEGMNPKPFIRYITDKMTRVYDL